MSCRNVRVMGMSELNSQMFHCCRGQVPPATYNGRHDKVLEEETVATVTVALKDEEVTISCHFATHRPATKKICS